MSSKCLLFFFLITMICLPVCPDQKYVLHCGDDGNSTAELWSVQKSHPVTR